MAGFLSRKSQPKEKHDSKVSKYDTILLVISELETAQHGDLERLESARKALEKKKKIPEYEIEYINELHGELIHQRKKTSARQEQTEYQMKILRMRLVKGEITKEDYEKIKTALEESWY